MVTFSSLVSCFSLSLCCANFLAGAILSILGRYSIRVIQCVFKELSFNGSSVHLTVSILHHMAGPCFPANTFYIWYPNIGSFEQDSFPRHEACPSAHIRMNTNSLGVKG